MAHALLPVRLLSLGTVPRTLATAGWADPDPTSPGAAFLRWLPEDCTTSSSDDCQATERL